MSLYGLLLSLFYSGDLLKLVEIYALQNVLGEFADGLEKIKK